MKLLLLLAGLTAVYLAGNGRTQLFDRDEPRYAQCSRQMLQSGDWVVPRLYDQIRAAKPPGIYWCQAMAMSVMGDTAFAARFPSAISTLLVGLLLGIGAWREVGARHALWAVFILTSSLLMLWSGKNCLTDAVLLLCTTIALGAIYLLWQGRGGWITPIILGAAVGFGGLVKGPFILGVLAGTIVMVGLLALLDRLRGADPSTITRPSSIRIAPLLIKVFVALGVAAALILPWLYLVHHRAPEFLGAARADALHHLETGSEGHSGPPGYHLALIWVTYLPWSLLLPLTIVLAFRNRQAPPIRFALAAVLGTWVFVEILQTKLPHYILPAFPALAFLTADAVIRCLDGKQPDLRSREMRIGAVILACVVAGTMAAPWWLAIKFNSYPWMSLIALTTFAVLYGCTVCFLFFTERPRAGLLAMGIGSIGIAVMLFLIYLPNAQPLRLPIRVAEVLKDHGAVKPHDAVMFEYKEPSLAFYQGGTIREYNYSLKQLAESPGEPRWAVIPMWVWEDASPQTRSAFDVIDSPIKGLDFNEVAKPGSSGTWLQKRKIDVLVLRRK